MRTWCEAVFHPLDRVFKFPNHEKVSLSLNTPYRAVSAHMKAARLFRTLHACD